MSAFRTAAWIVPLAASALTAAAVVGGCRGPAPPRDIILVTLDTTRADRVGPFAAVSGSPRPSTPTLDRLALESSVFLQASCQVPITTPSHATILTGLLPPSHGVRDNGMHVLPPAIETLAERLHVHGYRSHAVVASFALDQRFGLAQGFDSYDDAIGAAGDLRAERTASEVIDRAIAWLGADQRPAFLWAHLYDAHHPWRPPPPFDREFADRPYDGEIAFMDRELGRLFEALRAADRWRDALVIVVADHGEALGEHGERFHGTLVYDATIHVPLLVKWPGRPGPRRVATAVGTHDLVPTILAAIGAPIDPTLPGADLAALAADPDAGRTVYSEALTAELHYGWSRLRALRTDRWKVIEGAGLELYDLAADPGELDDRRAYEPVAAEALAASLATIDAGGTGIDAAIDPHAVARLAALGYVSAGGSGSGARELDPVTLIHLEGLLLDALELEATDPAQAADLYREVLTAEPGLKLALLKLAALEERTAPTAALALYLRLLDAYPDVEIAYSAALRLLVGLGQVEAAGSLAERGRAELPASEILSLDAASIALRRGDPNAAAELAAGVGPSGPNAGRAAYILALAAVQTGDQRATLLHLRRAVRAGYPADRRGLASEPSFASIRAAPEFLILLETSPAP